MRAVLREWVFAVETDGLTSRVVPVASSEIRVYLPGTTTLVSFPIYATETSMTDLGAVLTTDAGGMVEFWVDVTNRGAYDLFSPAGAYAARTLASAGARIDPSYQVLYSDPDTLTIDGNVYTNAELTAPDITGGTWTNPPANITNPFPLANNASATWVKPGGGNANIVTFDTGGNLWLGKDSYFADASRFTPTEKQLRFGNPTYSASFPDFAVRATNPADPLNAGAPSPSYVYGRSMQLYNIGNPANLVLGRAEGAIDGNSPTNVADGAQLAVIRAEAHLTGGMRSQGQIYPRSFGTTVSNGYGQWFIAVGVTSAEGGQRDVFALHKDGTLWTGYGNVADNETIASLPAGHEITNPSDTFNALLGRAETDQNGSKVRYLMATGSRHSSVDTTNLLAEFEGERINAGTGVSALHLYVNGGGARTKVATFSSGVKSRVISASAFGPIAEGSPAQSVVNALAPAWLLDASSAEAVGASIEVPSDWTAGAIAFKILWAATTTGAGNVVWQVFSATDRLVDGATVGGGSDSLTVAATTSVTALDTTATVRSVTPTARGGYLPIKVRRDAASGSDTYAADAAFLGVLLEYL
jgi:hypothetical protein